MKNQNGDSGSSSSLSMRSNDSNEKAADRTNNLLRKMVYKTNSRGKSAMVRKQPPLLTTSTRSTNFHENFKDLNPEYAAARRERVLRCAKNYLRRIGDWLKLQYKRKYREIFNA